MRNRTALALTFMASGSFMASAGGCALEDGELERTGSIQSAIIDGGIPSGTDNLAKTVVRLGEFCSGTLVTNRWVLTAAHCVGQNGPTSFPVTTSAGGAPATADWIIRHPEAAPPVDERFDSVDVALVHLASPLGTVTAPLASAYTSTNTTLTCYGWGDNTSYYNFGVADGDGFGTLRMANLTVTGGDSTRYNLAPNGSSQIQWHGDSGGPCFDSTGKITGVESGGSYTPLVPPYGVTLTVTGADQIRSSLIYSWVNAQLAGSTTANTDYCQTAPVNAMTGTTSHIRFDLAGAWNNGVTDVAVYPASTTTNSFLAPDQWDNLNGGWSDATGRPVTSTETATPT